MGSEKGEAALIWDGSINAGTVMGVRDPREDREKETDPFSTHSLLSTAKNWELVGVMHVL